MPAALSQRLQALFALVVDVAEGERDEFLRRECADDPQLLEQLKRLVHADVQLQRSTVRPVALGLEALVAQLAPVGSLEGSLIGAFRLCEPLGQGGMGSVYRAERSDGAMRQQVAVKFVRRELLDANTLRRFQLEQQTLALLDHPNIARLIDASALADGTPYFVMDYVAGIAITDYCDRARLGLRARLALFRVVCAAVSHAHRNLVVHRDLKPSNILVTEQGVPKLLDFGIAKSIDGAAPSLVDQTGTAQRFFSPRYAAPEQLLGAAMSVGVDIYALGLLLYELLAGVAPFDLDGLSAGQIERLITLVPPAAPSARRAKSPATAFAARLLHGDLDAIVLRCLRKAPSERYGSVEQLEDDLDCYLDGRPVAARNGQVLYRLRKFVGRHRLSTTVVVLASMALMLALALLLHQNNELTQERDLSRQSLGILKDAFVAADPIRASGADINARQILDAARLRVDANFQGRPALFAALAETIAEVDLSVGRAVEATDLLERALLAERRTGNAPQAQQRLMILLARALINSDRLSEARQRLQQARALSSAAPVEWKIAKGRLLALEGDAAGAIALLQDGLNTLAMKPPTVELANTARMALAEAYRLSGDHTRALAVLDDALRWQRAGLPETHPQITRTRMRRVVPMRDSGRVDESLTEALGIVHEIERIYGVDAPESAFAQTTLGRSLSAMGRTEEAIASYRRALHGWRRSLGQDHPNTLRAAFNLANSLQLDPKTAAEAEMVYRQLLELASKRAGEQDEMVVYYRLYFGRFLQQLGRPGEAFAVLALADTWSGLSASTVENRNSYLQILKILYDELRCASQLEAGAKPSADGPLQRCARVRDWLNRSSSESSAADSAAA